MHKHRRDQGQIDWGRAVGKSQSALHGTGDVMPLRDLGGNNAVPQCEFWMTYLIEENHHVDRDQRVIHKRKYPPLCIVVTDREEKHHTSIADCGLRIADCGSKKVFSRFPRFIIQIADWD